MEFERDVQNERPATAAVPINRVGIKNVLRKIEILKNNVKYSINANIGAYISLPANQRGIHMSRTAETIEDVINHTTIKPAATVEEFCIRTVDELLRKHEYTDHGEIYLEGKLFITGKINGRYQIQKAHDIYCRVIADRRYKKTEYDVTVGVSAEGITACPCALEMSREFLKKLIENRNFITDPDKLNELIELILPATHNQRAIGRVLVEGGRKKESIVDVLDLIDIIEDSMSARISSILKRPDEAEVVRTAHRNPLFVEDVVRNIALRLATDPRFGGIDDGCKVKIEATSMESIHYHDAYAELEISMGELRKYFPRS